MKPVIAVLLPAVLAQIGALAAGGLIGADTDGLLDPNQPLTTEFAIAGLGVGALLIVLNAAALSGFLARRHWQIVTRVAGSWIGAVAILVLALALAPMAKA